jgi:chaperone modulatory protein CbpM
MITIQTVCAAVPGLSEARLRQFLDQDWVRPDQADGQPVFHDIDVARVRLIVELNTELEIEEPTLPLVLSLLDQLYATRRQLRLVLDALDGDARDGVVARLTGAPE